MSFLDWKSSGQVTLLSLLLLVYNMWLRKSWLICCTCNCVVAVLVCVYPPRGVMVRSEACDWGISWPLPLTFFILHAFSCFTSWCCGDGILTWMLRLRCPKSLFSRGEVLFKITAKLNTTYATMANMHLTLNDKLSSWINMNIVFEIDLNILSFSFFKYYDWRVLRTYTNVFTVLKGTSWQPTKPERSIINYSGKSKSWGLR